MAYYDCKIIKKNAKINIVHYYNNIKNVKKLFSNDTIIAIIEFKLWNDDSHKFKPKIILKKHILIIEKNLKV